LNAYELAFDESLLQPIREVYRTLDLDPFFAKEKVARGKVAVGNYAFHVERYSNTMAWVSADDLATHGLFRRYFDSLDLEPSLKTMVDCERQIQVYCGFFVVADWFREPSFHVDYFDGANAYTLLTPLFALDPGHGHLLIRDRNNEAIYKYQYEVGSAIMIGDHLHHSTEPYARTGTRRVLLSLTFGTDKMQYWNVLRRTVGTQSDFMIMPCGHEKRTCTCVEALGA
jgi:hypothetical protein